MEKTVVSRSEGLTAAQQEEIQRIQSDRFDTSGSYIAAISEDTQATVKYNVKRAVSAFLSISRASFI